jgi:HAD superfamily hydrolase (TIGR01509 family)
MSYKAVIFDMDGLMFDTERLSCTMWKRAGKEHGYTIDDEIFMNIIGSTVMVTENIFKNAYGRDFPYHELRRIRLGYTDEYIKNNGVPVKKGLMRLLDYLGEKGVKKAVATSTEKKRALKVIHLAGITSHFECIIGGDDVQKSKPAPDIFLRTAEKLGVPAGECIVLEDSTKGINAAMTAGMLPVMVPDLKKPTREILEKGIRVCKDLEQVEHFLRSHIF